MANSADPSDGPASQDEKERPWRDPVIEYYKQFVDLSLLRENLKLTYAERIRKAESMLRSVAMVREAGMRFRGKNGPDRK